MRESEPSIPTIVAKSIFAMAGDSRDCGTTIPMVVLQVTGDAHDLGGSPVTLRLVVEAEALVPRLMQELKSARQEALG